MIRYQVRSRELIDIANDLQSRRLIKSPYFQRNLVWREIHKIDFIKTILLGLPFPQIFIAKGEIDLESMTTYACVVDGQQRLTAIQDYIRGEFSVDDKSFNDLDKDEKENFLKYQIPIIDLDIKQSDPLLKDIFKRLNRTFYALSNIEKISTEYAASDFMIVAKILADQLFIVDGEDEDSPKVREIDPLIPKEIIRKAKRFKPNHFQHVILESGVFTPHEISRKVPLNFSLNVMATSIAGWYNRNTGVTQLLEECNLDFDALVRIAKDIDASAKMIMEIGLEPDSYWLNKANLYSLLTCIYMNKASWSDFSPATAKAKLKRAARNIPEDYALAAKEAVNNKRERIIRNEYVSGLLFPAA
ncbi:DUF262 domain-containing protein [Burkholderia glumae]|uniref:DUF262 domain-containing protein n=1 Tax=Burkholderia glumae TaxID=337 RepID=UPI0020CC5E05|nr:DUF262 domain-containing protein [Burkholderia glumae]MCQ0030663.1 DUF262 domain-containing protein [Burkholderia glumae]MCQ0038043.1 DUF262 domain-containing protein [Burkholderia glumae]